MVGAVYLLYTFLIFPLFSHYVKVIHLVDADTLLVKDGDKIMQVQLIGIDAPEKTGPAHSPQCFDSQALHLTAEDFFSDGQDVRLVQDNLLGDTDNYGRHLRYVYLKNGDFLNEKMLENGLGILYTDPNKPYQKQNQLTKAQDDARSKNLGIWDPQGCNGHF